MARLRWFIHLNAARAIYLTGYTSMLSFRASLAILLSTAIIASPALATTTHPHHATASVHSHRLHHHRAARRAHRVRGQQTIDPERATQIQEALIRAHYLSGEPSGKWDAETQAAMQKYQADQGWQTKLMPDSRALKKLGLGPDYSDAINAKSATFSPPPPVSTIPSQQASGFAAASGANQ
ncbi:MAG TPA: peptidoglycan-binding domain-containing protein [Terracidiphilus sp.]|nr:peptidoglycan-binding domain-containing protein [Terracidiphilus sp.]